MKVINIGIMPVCPDCGKVMLFGDFDHKKPTIPVHCENSKCENHNIMFEIDVPVVEARLMLAH